MSACEHSHTHMLLLLGESSAGRVALRHMKGFVDYFVLGSKAKSARMKI